MGWVILIVISLSLVIIFLFWIIRRFACYEPVGARREEQPYIKHPEKDPLPMRQTGRLSK